MPDHKHHLVVLFGGQSCEHEVSVTSARSMLEHLDRDRYEVTLVGITKCGRWVLIDETSNVLAGGVVDSDAAPTVLVDHGGQGRLLVQAADGSYQPRAVDAVFPLLHGPRGEDGTVQGLLELAGIACVGSGVAGSAVAMDKELSKRVFRAEGLPQMDYLVVRRQRWQTRPDTVLLEIEGRLGWPVFVKPARLGSSVGVGRAMDSAGLRAALDEAARYDSKLIVEAAAVDCREVECSVLGNSDAEASVPGEIVPAAAFYDYQAKYVSGDSKLLIPAPIGEAATARVRELAVAAFRAVGAAGLARVDFFVSRADERVFINEVNTLPGFTPISMYPKLWQASGLEYSALIDRLVELALQRHAERSASQTVL